MLTVLTPAKVNLTLEVLAKRTDGFHEIRSVIQTIGLCDQLCFSPNSRLVFRCDEPGWLAGKSLVPRAARWLKKASACRKGAIIDIHKKIPLLSGLAGDSSDAAAVLRGLSKLWSLSLPPGNLARLASELGSDVPFFLFGGTALAQGRGEMVSPLPPLPHMWLVLLVPDTTRPEGKTGQLYASLEPKHYTNGRVTEGLVALLTRGGGITQDNLFNVFESIADNSFDGLDDYRQRFLKAGAKSVHLAGSGPTLFTLTKAKAKAKKIYDRLQKQGLECYLTETLRSIEP